jgi:hypothetical protein
MVLDGKSFAWALPLRKLLYLGNEDRNYKNSVVGFTLLAECLSDWPEVVTRRENSVGNYAWCVIFFYFS